ncbi:MAG: HupE/UreJ family protein [Thermoanaerobaculia bacterium]
MSTQRAPWLCVLYGCVAPILAAAGADGHNLELTDTVIIVKTDGTYQVDMTCDLDALALGAPPGADSAELAARLNALDDGDLADRIADLARYFERRVRIRFDDRPSRPIVSFPDAATVLAEAVEPPSFLGLTARLEGLVPEGAREMTFRASRSFPPVHLTILDQASAGGSRQLLELGVPSEPFRLDQPIGVPDRRDGDALPKTSGRYLVLGFWHIMPQGLDHILFVLGLFLLSARWRPLLWQVTAFTVAHAVTLTLATYGVIRLPSSVIEPLIALSIAWIAFENVLTSDLKPWRPFVVFGFGLLHGLGFAGVLGELGLPAAEFLTALLSFNAGIELGQLTVLVAAFAAVGWWRDRPWYRSRVTVPASALIGLIGLYWTIERFWG